MVQGEGYRRLTGRPVIRQLDAAGRSRLGENRKAVQPGGGGEDRARQQAQIGESGHAGGMDQFAGQAAVVVLPRLDDQDGQAERRERGGGGAARDSAPGDDGIDVDHPASPAALIRS